MPPDNEIEQSLDKATPMLEQALLNLTLEGLGCPVPMLPWVGGMIQLHPPYNWRKRKRMTDKLIPE